MDYCPHCIRPAKGNRCAHCGGDLHWTAQPHQLPVGSFLRGSQEHTYQLGAVIGQGGFGMTYIAMDLQTSERVAIKEYFPTRCAQRSGCTVAPVPGQEENYASGLRSFLAEAEMLAGVEVLPTIVSTRDYFEVNGTAYLVMEYLDGVPLHKKLAQEGKIPAADLLPKLPPLLRDLGCLHQAGIIHRDISPDNIMWMPDGTLKLLDFGCARSMEDGKSMTVLLKHGFAPVEQYQTRGQGPWTDVYGLSATIYYCLTGLIPPSAVDRLDNDTLQSPLLLGAGMTQEQADALMWGLTVQPKMRPVNVEVFAQRLFPAPPPPPPHPPRKSPQRTVRKRESKLSRLKKVRFSDLPKALRWKILTLAIFFAVLLLVLLIQIISQAVTGRGRMAASADVDSGSYAVPESSEFLFEPLDDGLTITGYSGREADVVIPDSYGGKTVTSLSAAAFSGLEFLRSVTVPATVTSADVDAFQDCQALEKIIFQGSLIPNCSFSGCDSLRCVLLGGSASVLSGGKLSALTLPEGCSAYPLGLDTGAGLLTDVVIGGDSILYALTDRENAVMLEVPDGLLNITMQETAGGLPVTYIYFHAFDQVESVEGSDMSLALSSEAMYDPEFLDILNDLGSVTWPDNTFSGDWLLTVALAEEINYMRRQDDLEPLAASEELTRLSRVRVEELPEQNSEERPNGGAWSDVLEDASVNGLYYSEFRYRADSMDDLVDTALPMAVENYTQPEDGYLYDQTGASLATVTEDGKTVLYLHVFCISSTEVTMGVTEDGLAYADTGGGLTITGYTGSETSVTIPDEIEGVQVTALAEEAFAGHDELIAVILPEYLNQIGQDAFRDCAALTIIGALTFDPIECADAFSGCSSLRCIYMTGEGLWNGPVPADCAVLWIGLETGVGPLDGIDLDQDGVLYALLESGEAVVMLIPSDVESLDLRNTSLDEPVLYIHANALDQASSLKTLILADTAFDYEMLDTLRGLETVNFMNESLAEDWIYACYMAEYINEQRGSGKAQILPSLELTLLAQLRAEELDQKYYSQKRPDGSAWTTVFGSDEADYVNLYHASTRIANSVNDDDTMEEKILEVAEYYIDAEVDGQLYTEFGLAIDYASIRHMAWIALTR